MPHGRGRRARRPDSTEKRAEGYAPFDLEHLLRVRHWKNWDQVIDRLQQSGDDDNEFAPGQVKSTVSDFERLRGHGQEFATDAGRLYELVRGRS